MLVKKGSSYHMYLECNAITGEIESISFFDYPYADSQADVTDKDVQKYIQKLIEGLYADYQNYKMVEFKRDFEDKIAKGEIIYQNNS